MTEAEKVSLVLRSQGHTLRTLPDELQTQLAALCDDEGNLAADVRQQVKILMADYYHSQKAVVEDTDK